MNERTIIRLFPNASRSLLEANGALPYTKLECDPTPALANLAGGKEESLRRVTVRFTGYRVQLLDPDNFAGSVKDLLDGLRRLRLIRGDEWHRVKLETEQVKVGTYAEQKTEIELTY